MLHLGDTILCMNHVLLSTLVLHLLACGTAAQTVPPGHPSMGPKTALPWRLYLRLDTDGKTLPGLADLKLSRGAKAESTNRKLNLSNNWPEIRLRRFIPKAKLVQRFEPAGDGPDEGSTFDQFTAGIQLTIEGKGRAYRQWLVAGDEQRNRLVSLVATWRYMAVKDDAQRRELFDAFRGEEEGRPELIVSRPGATARERMAVHAGAEERFASMDVSLRVDAYYPHFGIDKESGQPKNLSDQTRNPAANVLIQMGEKTEQRWVFARFPDFHQGKGKRLPVDLRLEVPIHRTQHVPDFAIVSIGKDRQEVWRHVGGAHVVTPLKVGEEMTIPRQGHRFRIAKFVPRGRLVESYEPADEKRGVPAVQLSIRDRARDEDGPQTSEQSPRERLIWLQIDRPMFVRTQAGVLGLGFGARKPWAQGGMAHPAIAKPTTDLPAAPKP